MPSRAKEQASSSAPHLFLLFLLFLSASPPSLPHHLRAPLLHPPPSLHQRWGDDDSDKTSADKALSMKAVMEQQRVHLTMNAIRQAARGDLQRLKELRQQGADFKMGDYDGRTALHLAAARGLYDVCQFILSEGTDVNRKGARAGLRR